MFLIRTTSDLPSTRITLLHWILCWVLGGSVGLALPFSSEAAAMSCSACHPNQQINLGFKHDSNQVTCQQCHGESAEHLKNPMQSPTQTFSAVHADSDLNPHDGEPSVAERQNQTCLGCHNDTQRLHWSFGAHSLAEVQCTDCHQLHSQQDAVMARSTQAEICTDCHLDIKALLNYPSRHPVAEGQVICSDCHDSHGNVGEHGLKTANPTDTCTHCHPETRGPFLFEHDPVTEDCGLCHQPHGSTIESMLVARTPFLCQQCHMSSGHPSRLADGTALNGGDNNLLARGCSNCHSQVHGSNHPAGSRLMR
ncbi:DmsE family decaheme c-type cytochrome [Pseudomonadales bacterium]|nr:DmsE family decaheme c-type cytochrome [Pseudomonadales bacterium]